jgi:hypothetical protein
MSSYSVPAFQIVSMTFAVAAVATGLQALSDPIGFSNTFGLRLMRSTEGDLSKHGSSESPDLHKTRSSDQHNVARSYVSLMGVRQLGTGITLLAFGYQRKWNEIATILSIIGILVAGTDGIFLARNGFVKQGQWHAVPGALIAALAISSLISGI